MFNLFREISFDIVANNGNDVEATFDFVERIVRLVAFDIRQCCFDIVAGVDGTLVTYRLMGASLSNTRNSVCCCLRHSLLAKYIL